MGYEKHTVLYVLFEKKLYFWGNLSYKWDNSALSESIRADGDMSWFYMGNSHEYQTSHHLFLNSNNTYHYIEELAYFTNCFSDGDFWPLFREDLIGK